MSLKLYMHPLSSYCHKVLIALYEHGTAFEPILVDLGNDAQRNNFKKVWPIGKFPVLRDDARQHTVPESTIIIEYLSQYYPGRTRLIPADPELAWQTRLQDRFFDLHLHTHMQKIVGNKLRPEGQKDPAGVEQAREQIQLAYDMVDRAMAGKTWIMGEQVTMADCAAAPALYYANLLMPLERSHKEAANYLARLVARPSYARALKEAEPYFAMFPGG
ncbi:MAG: glutathione S-transferase family protein [Steroidobacteraceae bacterium]